MKKKHLEWLLTRIYPKANDKQLVVPSSICHRSPSADKSEPHRSASKSAGLWALIALAVCIVLCIIPAVYASAALPRLIVAEASGQAGDNVTISVMLSGNTSVYSGSMNIVYDNARLELLSCEKGSSMAGIAPAINPNYAANTIRVNWLSLNVLTDGSLFKISFRVRNGAEGFADIHLSNVLLSDGNAQSTAFISENGGVTVGWGQMRLLDLTARDATGKLTEVLIPGTMDISAHLQNTLPIEAKPMLVAVLYDAGGKLIKTEFREAAAIGKNMECVLTVTCSIPVVQGYRLNILVYDGFTNLKPMSDTWMSRIGG